MQLLMELKKPRIHLKCKYLEKLKRQGLCRHARGELMGSPVPWGGGSPGNQFGEGARCRAQRGAGSTMAGAEPSEQLC